MNTSERRLTTGAAAKLCSVERDTVLKWIKKGRLAAERTAGGHFRIDPDELERVASGSSAREVSARQPMRCWEYLSADGQVREECRHCLAHRVGAAWCFSLRERGEDTSFCGGTESCEDCAYYRQAKGLSTRVLVVTDDETLLDKLRGENEEDLALCFARNGYEAATALERFHPGFAVVDEEVDRHGGAELVKELGADPRSPGLKIIYALGSRRATRVDRAQLEPGVVAVLGKPIGPAELRGV
ncbi:MAG: excisionase family DNA-binding protein, partial [bacterium]|nr:excisionase family DNA-binding protein [bacterium]